jgi:hypothetical protein
MKPQQIWLLVLTLLTLIGAQELMADEFPYPSEQELTHAQAGDVILNAATFP